MRKPKLSIIALMISALALIAAGCGGDSDAVSACKDSVEASGVDGSVKESALEACEKADDINLDEIPDIPGGVGEIDGGGSDSEDETPTTDEPTGGISDENLLEQCLANVENAVPEGPQRDAANDICENTYGG